MNASYKIYEITVFCLETIKFYSSNLHKLNHKALVAESHVYIRFP